MVEHHGLIGEGGEGNLPTFFVQCTNGREYTKNVNGKYFMGAVRHQEGEVEKWKKRNSSRRE